MEKLQVLIAEDEIAIANLIKNLIDFDRLHLECSGIVVNGQQAYEQILKSSPDIVITDISMPLINGLELIDKAQHDGIDSHFIIVSGMTHFHYALSAIKMGVEDYLLKPINRDELNDVLEKTVIKIATARKIDYQIQQLNQASHLQAQKLRRSFIMDILYNKPLASTLSCSTLNKEYCFSFLENSSYLMGVAYVDGINQLNLPTQNSVIEQLMRNFQTGIKNHCIDNEVHNKNNQFIFLINFITEEAPVIFGTISAIHEDMANHLGTYEGLSVAVACGIPVSGLETITYSLKTAYEALNARILLGSSYVLFAQKLLSSNAKPSYILPESEISALCSHIEVQEPDKARALLIRIFKNAALSARACPHLLLNIFRNTLSDLLSGLHQHKAITGNLTDTYMKYCDSMEQYATLQELGTFTVTFIMELLPFRNDKENQENRLIQTAKAYIQEHFSENLRLEDVSEQVYLAPSYFGVLFKKEVGESFSSYLTTVRMEQAKNFLRDAKYSIQDVANAAGYHDKRYFSKLFKKQVGVTPREYRKVYLN